MTVFGRAGCLGLSLRLGLCLTAMSAAAAQDSRIAQVERGLLPGMVTEATVPMRLVDRMRYHGVPGVSIAVVDQGRFAWAHAWGVAQAGKPQALTPDTLMQAGSISKSLTALGAFKLADQGKLSLDADVNALLRSWQLPPGAQTAEQPVTVRRVLGHTAGLTVHGFRGYVPGEPLPTVLQKLDGTPPANNPPVRVDLLPGSQWRYSGGGYVLLQQLMQDVTQEPFADWMQREVLRPAGMQTSLFGLLPDAPLTRVAAGHMEGREGRAIDGLRANKVELASGGLYTTPSDLARLSLGLQSAWAGQAQPWVSPARWREALQPALPGAETGMGFFLVKGGAWVGHDGRTPGFDARWLMDRSRAVIVMINGNAMPLLDELVRAVVVAHGWSDLAPERVSTAQLREAFSTTPIYLRGGMNEWGVSLPLKRDRPGRFSVAVDLPAGPVDFKFGSQDWTRVDLGAAFDGRPSRLAPQGGNLSYTAPRAGRYRFTLDVRQPAQARYDVRPLSKP